MSYDLIVIGGGPAGYLAAERAGQAGMSVLCIEKEHLGGTCLNEGCVPTKTLLYSAKLYDGVSHGAAYGVSANEAMIDHTAVIDRKDKVVSRLVKGVGAALKANRVKVVMAKAIILPRNGEQFRVQADDEIYEGSRLLIATGSTAVIPPIPGLEEGLESGFVMTNREILATRELPRKLAIIGGGVIGLEFAAYFCEIGCDVTVIEMMDHIAGPNDPDLVALLQKNCEKRGIRFLLNTKVVGITDHSILCERNGEPTELSVDRALLSIGRRANIAGLNLESIGVRTERGAVVTDEHMQTNIANVYAAGDVNGKSMLAHVAYREAEVAVHTMLGKRDFMRYSAVPTVLYTNPEMSAIGESEVSAKEKGIDFQIVKIPMEYAGRYVAENEEGGGICKLIIRNDTHTIVGAHFLCNYSSEFLVALAAFIELELPLDDIMEIIFPHPTVSEIIREAVFQAKFAK